ncbi:hypothetical protein E4U60_007299 [Claviceps pazoutovae]|uniref:Cyanovirin-N domain-containing protein n=1 Tax=Claviceps pazoutovae TaxID=1649127 RepID=A0A9P7MG39_9HYPO|nr:hypothetical protein E4U60_007299 [Claviceps pazoutovae]
MYALSLLALLLPLVAADTHNWCTCLSWSKGGDWGVNQQLSYFVCSQDYKGVAKFNIHNHLCEGLNGYQFDGDTWEGHCKAAGMGYFPITSDGNMDIRGYPLRVDAALGSC